MLEEPEDALTENAEPALDFPVVGIGASAGGLEAITEMFHGVSGDTGLAFVLVLHLDPNHESLMAELLSRKTHLSVRQIEDGDHVAADTIHVIPPGYSLEIKNGRFILQTFSEPRGLRRPIDGFFTSLAEAQGDKCASVVLSGTGADGSFGMRAIKEYGGICAAQTPKQARYDGMPISAIGTDLVDYILPAKEIVGRLKSYFEGVYRPDIPSDADDVEHALLDIFGILKKQTGHDFSGYKRSTLFRRLERRMQVLEFTKIGDYTRLLIESEAERRTLFQDFLINVTSFFRDPDSFDALREKVIAPMIRKSDSADELRIWVPGCASGQEAYSIAMMVDDLCKDRDHRPLVQIFASDIDERMIDFARRAQYPASTFSQIPAQFQQDYTLGQDSQFEIVKRIRDMVRFSVHNLTANAPFSKIDLISCRNLLIYFGEEMQREVLPVFHFSLREKGFLFLGNSENVTRREEMFEPVDQRARIFRRVEQSKRTHISLPLGAAHAGGSSLLFSTMPPETDFPRHNSLDASNLSLYEQYAPPFVRVTSDGRIIDSSGDLSLFLMSRPSDERHLFTLAREGLRDVVMPLLADALERKTKLALKGIEVISPFGMQTTDVVAQPMKDGTAAVLFIVRDRLVPQVDEYAVVPATRDQQLAELQENLQSARLLLKSKVEEIETANEELKSSNEEMMSMNEELQSANEELTTANEELKNKIDELSVANADLDNFMHSAELMMIVLDRALCIRHVTLAAKKAFSLRDTDRGRSITEFSIGFRGVDFAQAIRTVLDSGQPMEKSVSDETTKKAFVLRITPYFFGDGSVEGATITMVDVTEVTGLRDDLRLETERLALAMDAANMGVAEMDIANDMVSVTDVTAEHLGVGGQRHLSFKDLVEYIDPEDLPPIEGAIARARAHGEAFDLEFRVHHPDGGTRWIRNPGKPYTTRLGEQRIVGLTRDITDDKLAMDNREMLIREMSHRVKNLFAVISGLIRTSPKIEEETISFAEDLVSRITALGESYDLARRQYDLDGVNFDELLDRIVKPHCTAQEVSITGPEALIRNHYLTTVTLIFHELATNALKYGGLSRDDGTLDVHWTVSDDETLSVTWSETVPDFTAPDLSKTGFGSRLIEMGVRQLDADFKRSLSEDGMAITLTFKL